jgi:hypothetical protein
VMLVTPASFNSGPRRERQRIGERKRPEPP